MITADKIYSKVQALYFEHRRTASDNEGWSNAYGKDFGEHFAETRSTFSVVTKVNGSPANITMQRSHVRDCSGHSGQCSISDEYIVSVGKGTWFSLSGKGVLSGGLGDLIKLAQAKGALMAITGEDIPIDIRFF